MLKSKAFPIEKIYVPTKRRQTLDVEKVRQIAESMLQNGQDTPIVMSFGFGSICKCRPCIGAGVRQL